MTREMEKLFAEVHELAKREKSGAGVPTMAKVVTVTANKTITSVEAIGGLLFFVNTGAGAVTLTLPPATSRGVVVVKRSGANNVVIQRSGSDLIDGQVSVMLTVNLSAVVLAADGGGAWYIVSKYL